MKIDAEMVLAKKGSLSLKVKQLTGKARLQFTRRPFSHWSICFINEPFVDLAIESQIQGRTMQSNVTSLILTAVKKAIRRKHTLPNYKLRFKPFFNRLVFEDIDLPVEPSGTLEVTIRNITRLNYSSDITSVYATLTLSEFSWVTANQLDDQNIIISLDIEIHKAKNQQIGIIFKQTNQAVVIESILPNTPAYLAKIQREDILISIEGRKLNHINHVAKFLKSVSKTVLIFRVERIIPGIIKNDAISESFADIYEDFTTPAGSCNTNISFSKNSESVQIGSDYKFNSRSKDVSSNESSKNSTPSNSPKKVATININDPKVSPQHTTIDFTISDFVLMDEVALFNLHPSTLFLNVNVFGRSMQSDISLLGYLSIPVENILAECESNLKYIEKFILSPPEVPEPSNHPLSTQSGFCSRICYGDASIAFAWNQDRLEDLKTTGSQPEELQEIESNKRHAFVRTQFNRSTFCGNSEHFFFFINPIQSDFKAITQL